MLLIIVLVMVGLTASATTMEGIRRARIGQEMERASNALRPARLLMDPIGIPSEDVRVIATNKRTRVVNAPVGRRYWVPDHNVSKAS
jgi:hypothetical protein